MYQSIKDLEPLYAKLSDFRLRRKMVEQNTYTVEDVILTGLRVIERDRKWYAENPVVSIKDKLAEIEALKAELAEFKANQ